MQYLSKHSRRSRPRRGKENTFLKYLIFEACNRSYGIKLIRRSHSISFQPSGGAIGRVAADATAFPHRDSKHNMLCNTRWPLGTEGAEHLAYVEAFWKGIEPYTQGFYTNDMLEQSQGMVNRNYLGNYRRLVEIKNQYDPGNLFRLNANVQPSV